MRSEKLFSQRLTHGCTVFKSSPLFNFGRKSYSNSVQQLDENLSSSAALKEEQMEVV